MSLTKRLSKIFLKKAVALALTGMFVLNPLVPLFERSKSEVSAAVTDNSNWRGILEKPAQLSDGTYNTTEANGNEGGINFGANKEEIAYTTHRSGEKLLAQGPIKWFIVGKDTDSNLVLTPSVPFMTATCFMTDSTARNDLNLNTAFDAIEWLEDESTYSEIRDLSNTEFKEIFGVDTVYQSHYGSSKFRQKLQRIAKDLDHFTEAEQNLMLVSAVKNIDTYNGNTPYITADKLYGVTGKDSDTKHTYAGLNDQLEIFSDFWKSSYWTRFGSKRVIWGTRCAYSYTSSSGKIHNRKAELELDGGDTSFYSVAGACKLDLSAIHFGLNATIPTDDTSSSGFKKVTVGNPPVFNLRIKDNGKSKVMKGKTELQTNTTSIEYTAGTDERLVIMAQSTSGGSTYQYVKDGTGTQELLDLCSLSGLTRNTTYSIKAWTEKKDSAGNANMYYASEPSEFTLTIPSNTSVANPVAITGVVYKSGLTLASVTPPPER